ncbi:NACHT domain-containing protein [Sphingobium sp. DEHP117]|uniref:NACHT domain-containing protein n=1 Tax=Sphingobium sp. DEHP117 TaxID=2993436 RepID=UPI0027D738B2|nr:NACHT domain-containing protein [Sphingobium sp. DEHP117]MDQ4421385.1 NACHT domain-containing protein [Sphingobium sp. DEHP117]
MGNQSEPSFLDSLIAEPKVRRLFVAAFAASAKGLKNVGYKTLVELVTALTSYESYLVQTNKRVSTIKTFAAPTRPVPLSDHFVDIFLRSNNDAEIDHLDLLEKSNQNCRVVISASAGFGKSILMRYMALCLYEKPTGKIPIFVELRDFNRLSKIDIIEYIHLNYRQQSELDSKVLIKALEKGIFSIFLDGFDEINFDKRSLVEQEIIKISQDFPDISLFVSGRPDEKFDSWKDFHRFSIEPMKLDQVKSLITKIEYDQGVKQRFLDKLDDGLYENHSSFLSTPLLATLMMLTYEQNANIPDKMHLFYQRAFETLFEKHDTYKEQYERKTKSGLRIDEFSKLFSTFCMNTYLTETFEFSHVGILEAIDDAISYCGYTTSADNFLFDLIESVCLVQKEGLFYSFIHRSFQEYFSALFLCHCPDELRDEFLESMTFRPWDSVLIMLFDMTKDRLEAAWVRPKAKAYIDFVEKFNSRTGTLLGPLLARWDGLEIRIADGRATFWNLKPGPYHGFCYVMSRFYEILRDKISFLTLDVVDEAAKIVAESQGLIYTNYSDHLSSGDLIQKGKPHFEKFDEKYSSNKEIDLCLQERVFFEDLKKIFESIEDSSIIKQKFLEKIKGNRSER